MKGIKSMQNLIKLRDNWRVKNRKRVRGGHSLIIKRERFGLKVNSSRTMLAIITNITVRHCWNDLSCCRHCRDCHCHYNCCNIDNLRAVRALEMTSNSCCTPDLYLNNDIYIINKIGYVSDRNNQKSSLELLYCNIEIRIAQERNVLKVLGKLRS